MPPTSYIPSTKIAETRAAAEQARAAAERLIRLCDAAAHDAASTYSANADSWRTSHAALAAAITKPTARQILEPWGLDRIDTTGVSADVLDTPVLHFGFTTSRDAGDRGAVFCYCAGKALMALTLDNVPRTTLYLSLDDSDHAAWHHHRSTAMGAGLEPAPGRSPSVRLRLVIAA